MIDFLWKLSIYWTLYETFRAIAVYLVRAEIGRVANTRSKCSRCQWRIFCTRTTLRLSTLHFLRKARVSIILFGIAIGNADTIWLVLQKLLEERKALNVRRKEKSSMPRSGLPHGK